MAINFLPQAQLRLGRQELDFQPLAQGVDSVIQGNRQNAMLEARRQEAEANRGLQREQMGAQAQRQNAMLELQRQKLARGPERPWWAGQDGKIDPAMQQYRELGRPQTNVNVNATEESAYDKELGKSLSKYFVEGQQAAGKSRSAIANMEMMREALKDPNVYTGTGGQAIQGLKKAAQTLFGVPVKGVASGEIIQNLSDKVALSFKEELGAPFTDSDLAFVRTFPPSITKSTEGNRRIIELGLLHEQYKLDRALAANEYRKRPESRGRLDAGFFDYLQTVDQKYAPLFAAKVNELRTMVEDPQRSPSVGTPTVGTIMDGFRYRGGDPADQKSWEPAQ